MSIRDEALRLLESLPEDASWEEVFRALSGRARSYPPADAPPMRVAELQSGYSPAPPPREGEASQSRREEEEMGYAGRITLEPGKRSGKPCVRGLRITVSDVLDYLASGMSEDEILDDFPDLERADIRACLAFAADRERKLVTLRA